MERVSSVLVASFFLALSLSAQEVVVDFCEPEDCPEPDPDCCTDDTLEIVFPDGTSVFEFARFERGMRIDTGVVLDTVSEQLQGWSFSVKHDWTFLALIDDTVTIDGTDAAKHMGRGFCVTRAVPGGWISAVVLDLRSPVYLPAGLNTLAFASYTLEENPGPRGTVLRLADGEIGPGAGVGASPPTDINLTVGGRARRPHRLVHGLIREGGRFFLRGDADGDAGHTASDAVRILGVLFASRPERIHCDDALDVDDDGSVTVADAVRLLLWLFRGGTPPAPPFVECGVDETRSRLTCAEGSPACP